jgi:hypothetical protein
MRWACSARCTMLRDSKNSQPSTMDRDMLCRAASVKSAGREADVCRHCLRNVFRSVTVLQLIWKRVERVVQFQVVQRVVGGTTAENDKVAHDYSRCVHMRVCVRALVSGGQVAMRVTCHWEATRSGSLLVTTPTVCKMLGCCSVHPRCARSRNGVMT